jgi:hypothetical protein
LLIFGQICRNKFKSVLKKWIGHRQGNSNKLMIFGRLCRKKFKIVLKRSMGQR